MGAALVGGTLASLGIGEAAADDLCKPEGKKCRKNAQCCSGTCSNGACAPPPPPPPTQTLFFCSCVEGGTVGCLSVDCSNTAEMEAFCRTHCLDVGLGDFVELSGCGGSC